MGLNLDELAKHRALYAKNPDLLNLSIPAKDHHGWTLNDKVFLRRDHTGGTDGEEKNHSENLPTAENKQRSLSASSLVEPEQVVATEEELLGRIVTLENLSGKLRADWGGRIAEQSLLQTGTQVVKGTVSALRNVAADIAGAGKRGEEFVGGGSESSETLEQSSRDVSEKVFGADRDIIGGGPGTPGKSGDFSLDSSLGLVSETHLPEEALSNTKNFMLQCTADMQDAPKGSKFSVVAATQAETAGGTGAAMDLLQDAPNTKTSPVLSSCNMQLHGLGLDNAPEPTKQLSTPLPPDQHAPPSARVSTHHPQAASTTVGDSTTTTLDDSNAIGSEPVVSTTVGPLRSSSSATSASRKSATSTSSSDLSNIKRSGSTTKLPERSNSRRLSKVGTLGKSMKKASFVEWG